MATINEDAVASVSIDESRAPLSSRSSAPADCGSCASAQTERWMSRSDPAERSSIPSERITRFARALVQKDGRIVVLGTEEHVDGTDATLTRYWD